MADPVKFWKALEVADIATALKEEWHPWLLEFPLICVFRSKHAVKNGMPKLATAKRLTGLNAYLAFREFTDQTEEDYPPFALVIEVAHDLWPGLTEGQRVALVDHELCHFDEEGGTRGHDLEEFRVVVERHGMWMPNIEEFVKSATDGQEKLFDIKDAVEAIRPKKGSGIDSITFSSPGHDPVTLRAK